MSDAAARARAWLADFVDEVDTEDAVAASQIVGLLDRLDALTAEVERYEQARQEDAARIDALVADLDRVTREHVEAMRIEAGEHEAIPSRVELTEAFVRVRDERDEALRLARDYNAQALAAREREQRALSLLGVITSECEALSAALVADAITASQARVRVQNIHGLAATPQVEEWPDDAVLAKGRTTPKEAK
jgi:hypothetical protein